MDKFEFGLQLNGIYFMRKYETNINSNSLICYCPIRVELFMKYSPYIGRITKTRLYNIDPLKPHFYIVKMRFTGVYIIFRISAQNIDCGYSLEPPRRGGSNKYPQSMF